MHHFAFWHWGIFDWIAALTFAYLVFIINRFIKLYGNKYEYITAWCYSDEHGDFFDDITIYNEDFRNKVLPTKRAVTFLAEINGEYKDYISVNPCNTWGLRDNQGINWNIMLRVIDLSNIIKREKTIKSFWSGITRQPVERKKRTTVMFEY